MAERCDVMPEEAIFREIEPNFDRLVDFSKFVVVYSFTANGNKWKRTGHSGLCGIFTRSDNPLHNLAVYNEDTSAFLIEPICSGMIVQVQDPFLLYLNCKDTLFGLWFRERSDFTRISCLVGVLADEAENVERSANFNCPNLRQSEDASNIMSRAREAYRRSVSRGEISAEITPEVGEAGEAGAIEGAVGGASEDDDDEGQERIPKCVLDFLSVAGSEPINAQMGLLPGITSTEGDDYERSEMNPLIHHILSNPNHSLEYVENRQRVAPPARRERSITDRLRNAILRTGEGRSNLPPASKPKKSKLKVRFPQLRIPSPTSEPPDEIVFESFSPLSLIPPLVVSDNEKERHRRYAAAAIRKAEAKPEIDPELSAEIEAELNSGIDPELRAEIEAELNNDKDEGINAKKDEKKMINKDAEKGVKREDKKDEAKGVKKEATIEPKREVKKNGRSSRIAADIGALPQNPVNEVAFEVDPLTKGQLLQAVKYLLRNDPTFLTTIHEAYAKSLNEVLR